VSPQRNNIVSLLDTFMSAPSPSGYVAYLSRSAARFPSTLRLVYRVPLVFTCLLLVVLEPLLLRKDAAATARAVAKWTRRILRVARLELTIEGQIPDGTGLFVANHRSYIDILVILAHLPVTFLCKHEVRTWPLVGQVAHRIGTVFVDRRDSASRRASLSLVSSRVIDGARIVAFPEGTTARGPAMRPTYPGLFKEAERRGFPLFPMVIEYADPDDAWVDDDTLLRHVLYWLSKPTSRARLCFGPPMQSTEQQDLQPRAETWMRSALLRIHQYPW
jgi:1-acyl-sn-glycerol-3-phosphate acyltransferase